MIYFWLFWLFFVNPILIFFHQVTSLSISSSYILAMFLPLQNPSAQSQSKIYFDLFYKRCTKVEYNYRLSRSQLLVSADHIICILQNVELGLRNQTTIHKRETALGHSLFTSPLYWAVRGFLCQAVIHSDSCHSIKSD